MECFYIKSKIHKLARKIHKITHFRPRYDKMKQAMNSLHNKKTMKFSGLSLFIITDKNYLARILH